MPSSRKGMPLHAHLWMLFGAIILLVGLLASGLNYWVTRAALQAATADASQQMAGTMRDEVEDLLAPAQTAITLIRYSAIANDGTPHQRDAWLSLAREALESAPVLQAVYIGYADGTFLYLRPLRSDADRAIFKAPDTAYFVLRSVLGTAPALIGQVDFLDRDLRTVATLRDQEYAERFDPRKRVWYQAAIGSDAPVRTDPYLFFSDQEVGTTFAFRTPHRNAVVGGDFRLDWLGTMLAKKKATPGTMLALLDSNGKVLGIDNRLPESSAAPDAIQADLLAAPADYNIPVLTAMATAFQGGARQTGRKSITVDGMTWYTTTDVIPATTGKPLYLLMAVPQYELLANAKQQAWTGILFTLAIVLLSIPLTWLVAHRLAKPLSQLADGMQAIRSFDFDKALPVQSTIREVGALGAAAEQMRQTIRRFLAIVQAVAAEDRLERLLPVLLEKTLAEAGGTAGIFFLVDENDIRAAAIQDRHGNDAAATKPSYALDEAPSPVRDAVRQHRSQSADLDRTALAAITAGDMTHGGATCAVAIPVVNRKSEARGVILVIRDTPMNAAQLAYVETLSALYAGSIEVRELADAQRKLFDGFIRLLADAIDAKSPHTGGHCSRVPALAKLLAQAACDATDGPFRSFQMTGTEWETLHVAAWLHDCGKITTPEYIIDKATKLETLHDRLHEVRMRFEVMKRDAEIGCLEGIVAGDDPADARTRLQQTLRELDDDFAFVAACNQGTEAMDAHRKARLLQIASRTWTRTLDDRIGLSREATAHLSASPAPSLPVREPLLADKPEHRVPRGAHDTIAPDNPWGFRRDAPPYLHDRGELHNLLIGRGTLTAEERYKIEDHIVQTQIMLSRLPFPRHLRQVPEVAGNHHEKMDGTGYPRRLRREDMSTLSRMMAVADIFEALTAADRPYKNAKTLSESIDIMYRAATDGHIDPEIFELFLTSGAYLAYAQQYMQPAQIDKIDVERYRKQMRAGSAVA